MATHNELGRWGEDLASRYLLKKGFYTRHRDWHWGKKDIDIVAIDEDSTLLLFVEVKTRSTDLFGEPEEAVDTEKVRNLLDAADAYVHQFYLGDIEKRFDIISIVGTNEQNAKVRHIEDAFDVLSGFYK